LPLPGSCCFFSLDLTEFCNFHVRRIAGHHQEIANTELQLFHSFSGEFSRTNSMSKSDCMADCPAALSSGLLLHAQLAADEQRMPENNDGGDSGCGRSNFLRMLRAFFLPARSVATQEN